MKPGQKTLDLGLGMRMTKEVKGVEAHLDYNHRLSENWSATIFGEAGAAWEQSKWDPYVEILGGMRANW